MDDNESFIDDRCPTIWGGPPASYGYVNDDLNDTPREPGRLKPIDGALLRKLHRATMDEKRKMAEKEKAERLRELERSPEPIVKREVSPPLKGFYVPQRPLRPLGKSCRERRDEVQGRQRAAPAEQRQRQSEHGVEYERPPSATPSYGDDFDDVAARASPGLELDEQHTGGEKPAKHTKKPEKVKNKKKHPGNKEIQAVAEAPFELDQADQQVETVISPSISKSVHLSRQPTVESVPPSRHSRSRMALENAYAPTEKAPTEKSTSFVSFEEIGMGWVGQDTVQAASERHMHASSKRSSRSRRPPDESAHSDKLLSRYSATTIRSRKSGPGNVADESTKSRSIADTIRTKLSSAIQVMSAMDPWEPANSGHTRHTLQPSKHSRSPKQSHSKRSSSGLSRHGSQQIDTSGDARTFEEEGDGWLSGRESKASKTQSISKIAPRSRAPRETASMRESLPANENPARESDGSTDDEFRSKRHFWSRQKHVAQARMVSAQDFHTADPREEDQTKDGSNHTFEKLDNNQDFRPTVFAGKGWISPHPLSRTPTEDASPPDSKIILPSDAFPRGAILTYSEWKAMQERGLEQEQRQQRRNFSPTESFVTMNAKREESRHKFVGWGAQSIESSAPASYHAPTVESAHSSDGLLSDERARSSRHNRVQTLSQWSQEHSGSKEARDGSEAAFSKRSEDESSHRSPQWQSSLRSSHHGNSRGSSPRSSRPSTKHRSDHHSSRHQASVLSSQHGSSDHSSRRESSHHRSWRESSQQSDCRGIHPPQSQHSGNQSGGDDESSLRSRRSSTVRGHSNSGSAGSRGTDRRSDSRSREQPRSSLSHVSKTSSERAAEVMEEGRNVWSDIPQYESAVSDRERLSNFSRTSTSQLYLNRYRGYEGTSSTEEK